MHRITIVDRSSYCPLFDKCWSWRSSIGGHNSSSSVSSSINNNNATQSLTSPHPLSSHTPSPSSSSSSASPTSPLPPSSSSSPSSASQLIALFSQFSLTLNGGSLNRVTFSKGGDDNGGGNGSMGGNKGGTGIGRGTLKKRTQVSGMIRAPLTLHPQRTMRKRSFHTDSDSVDMYCSANSSIIVAIFIDSSQFPHSPQDTATLIRDQFFTEYSSILSSIHFSSNDVANESYLPKFISFEKILEKLNVTQNWEDLVKKKTENNNSSDTDNPTSNSTNNNNSSNNNTTGPGGEDDSNAIGGRTKKGKKGIRGINNNTIGNYNNFYQLNYSTGGGIEEENDEGDHESFGLAIEGGDGILGHNNDQLSLSIERELLHNTHNHTHHPNNNNNNNNDNDGNRSNTSTPISNTSSSVFMSSPSMQPIGKAS